MARAHISRAGDACAVGRADEARATTARTGATAGAGEGHTLQRRSRGTSGARFPDRLQHPHSRCGCLWLRLPVPRPGLQQGQTAPPGPRTSASLGERRCWPGQRQSTRPQLGPSATACARGRAGCPLQGHSMALGHRCCHPAPKHQSRGHLAHPSASASAARACSSAAVSASPAPSRCAGPSCASSAAASCRVLRQRAAAWRTACRSRGRSLKSRRAWGGTGQLDGWASLHPPATHPQPRMLTTAGSCPQSLPVAVYSADPRFPPAAPSP